MLGKLQVLGLVATMSVGCIGGNPSVISANCMQNKISCKEYTSVELTDKEKNIYSNKKSDYGEGNIRVGVRLVDKENDETKRKINLKAAYKNEQPKNVDKQICDSKLSKNEKWNYNTINVNEDMKLESDVKTENDSNAKSSETEIAYRESNDLTEATHKNENQKNKIKVAIIDSGINVGNGIDVVGQIDLVPGTEDVSPLFWDVSGHGDSIAGIIAGNNGDKIKGICPEIVEIYSARVLDENNEANVDRIIAGIEWAIGQDVNIINMSFGTTEDSEKLHNAIKKAYDNGILMIAAAGNTGDKTDYPAAYDEVVAVGSIDTDGTISEFSANDEYVDLLAPGEMVESIGALSGTVICDGTSVAAAHVSAVAACIWSNDTSKTSEFVRNVLYMGANKVDESIAEAGIVDYEYSMEVYDKIDEICEESEATTDMHKKRNIDEDVTEFAEQNLKDEILNKLEKTIPENDNIIKSYSEAVVEASWSDHNAKAKSAGANAAMQAGAYFLDQVASGLSGVTENPLWHAHRETNAFISYRYLVKVGNAVKGLSASATASQIKSAIKSVPAVTGMDSSSYSTLKNNLCKDTVIDKLKAYSGDNKRSFIMGMASHIATDLYAHQSYFYGTDGKWYKNTHSYSVIDYRHCDNTGNSGNANRYLASKEVLENVVLRDKGSRYDEVILRDFYDDAYKYYKFNGKNYSQKYADFKLTNCKSKIKKAGMDNSTILAAFGVINY